MQLRRTNLPTCGRWFSPNLEYGLVVSKPKYSPFAVQKVQKRNFQGAALWMDGPLSPGRAVAMLFPRELELRGGGCHASATGTTGQGDPWAKRLGDDHRARRRCGPTHRADGQDGLAGGLGSAHPTPLEATGAQWGVDSRDLAGVYPEGRRPPESLGGNLPQGHAPHQI